MNKYIILVLMQTLSIMASAQSVTISGTVTSTSKEPIYFALVNIKGTNIYTNTNEKGAFKLAVPKGKQTLSISMLGYVTVEKELTITAPITAMNIVLKDASLQIEGVVVTAQTSQSKEGSSTYSIGQDAINQVQAISLTDIVSLLPGGKLEPQKLTSTAQVDFRSAESSSVNAFGTSIIVDGTPLSNDANLQVSNPSSSLSGGTNVANKGVDLREIPASNIESVEVVTGVASAKYGNITSGAVIVTRKAGYAPLFINFNSTPSSYQASAARGFKLKNKLGYLNVDADYAYSINRPTERKDFFQRINMGMRWTTTVYEPLNWSNTMSFSYGFSGDGRRKEPEEVLLSNRDIKNNRFVFSTNGRLNILGKLSYNLSVNTTKQYTKLEQEVTDGPRPLVEPLESGTYFTTFSPLSFMQTTIMKGLPLNIYGRLEADQNTTLLKHNFNFSTGVEYSFDKNFGKGRVVGGESVGAAGLPGSRGMKFNDIPASKTFSAYHQMNITRELEHITYQLRAGIRYDNMIERYNLFSPRLAGTVGFMKNFKVRGAWGLSYKAPSIITLYPGPIYFDITNLSYYDPIPEERLAIVTSYVLHPVNTNLKPSKGETEEISLEWGDMGYNVKITGYKKSIRRGITSSSKLVILENQHYKVVEEPAGRPPVVEIDEGNISYLPRTYSSYVNNFESTSKGLEFTLSTPRLNATKTSFNLTGQMIETESLDNTPSIKSSNASSSKNRYGVYNNYIRTNRITNANLTVIQPLSKLRMMITLTTELNIYSKSYQKNPSLYPVGYYDDRGSYIEIPEEDRMNEEFTDLFLNENQFNPTKYPFYPNFHLQIRKETRQGHNFSFYANNCFWYNPYYTNEYSNSRSRLNSRISFGFGIGIKL